MKKSSTIKNYFFSLFLVLFVSLIFLLFSCKKEEPDNNGKGQLKFYVVANSENLLKSVRVDEVLSSIVISVDKSDGTHILSNQKLALRKFESVYITEPLILGSGNYKLTYYAVLDASNQVKYLSPLAGSSLAPLVKHPLSIDFTINKDQVCILAPEVLSVEGSVPADFGLTDFKFQIFKPVQFFVYSYNSSTSNYELTTASLTISNGTTNIISATLLAKSNIITVPLDEEQYVFRITKPLHNTYIDTLTKSEIEAMSSPINVRLDLVELIAYFPFNGNSIDESGNGNDGTVYGATPTTDRNGNNNSAFSFDGVDDYISVNSSFISGDNQGTVLAWVKFNNVDNTQYIGSGGNKLSQDDYLSTLRLDPIEHKISIYTHNSLGDSYVIGSTTIQAGVYYFVGMTSDGNTWNLFVNGNKETLTVKAGNNTGAWMNDFTMDNFTIGDMKVQETYVHPYLNGVLDEIRIYNRALDELEIKALYNE